jgi:hypothetical protein
VTNSPKRRSSSNVGVGQQHTHHHSHGHQLDRSSHLHHHQNSSHSKPRKGTVAAMHPTPSVALHENAKVMEVSTV